MKKHVCVLLPALFSLPSFAADPPQWAYPLVTTGASGKTIPCAICHGQDLKGLGEVPRIAGISPLYAARQLFGVQSGARAGNSAALMKQVVANLSEEDIVAIVAYLGTREP